MNPARLPPSQTKPYSDLVAALCTAGEIPAKDLGTWQSMVFLRNSFSHRTSAAPRARHEAISQLSFVAELLNRLVQMKSISQILAGLVAFLNSEGGRILWGVRNSDRVVVGVRLASDDRDRLRQVVTNKL